MEPCDTTDTLPLDVLIDSATAPEEIESDGQRVQNRKLDELIALDKYLALRRASCRSNGNGWGMIAKSRVVPPSAVGEDSLDNGSDLPAFPIS